ncbi:hypothetical protein [Streptomyces chartreusis]|uniref:hypothetical protein n=1 Tax=Streptomyces chartreusis TaxID=1969 RepID=UPI0036AB0466
MEKYADWSEQLVEWKAAKEKLVDYLVEAGLCEADESPEFDATVLPPATGGSVAIAITRLCAICSTHARSAPPLHDQPPEVRRSYHSARTPAPLAATA